MRLRPLLPLVAFFLTLPTVAFAQASAEDVEAPRAAPPPGSDLPWFTPPANAAFVPPPPPPPPPPPRTEPTEEEKMHGRSLELNIEPAFFVGSNASGAAVSTLARFTWPAVGFDVGVMSSVPFPTAASVPTPTPGIGGATTPASVIPTTAAFVLGFSFIHYSAELYTSGPDHVYLVLPEIDLRFLFTLSSVPSPAAAMAAETMPGGSSTSGGFAPAIGGSLLGVRYAHCLGRSMSIMGEFRGPTAFLYAPVTFAGDPVNPYGSVGFSLAGGLGF